MGNDFFNRSGLQISDEEAKKYIVQLAKGYREKKKKNKLYNYDDFIPENIIAMYLLFVLKKKYSLLIENYSSVYVENEAIVEPGVTEEEKEGLKEVYNYIKSFNYNNDFLNLFITPLKLHELLYSKCQFPEFGGKLRQESAVMNDTDIDVLDATSAKIEFQKYLLEDVTKLKDDIFCYINWSIKTTVDLIRIQPFPDGNKRTFRALLNLLLGYIGIPPIYIEKEEREEYKKELLNALSNHDYKGITRFYYYKICDSIVNFGIKNIDDAQKIENQDEHKSFIIK